MDLTLEVKNLAKEKGADLVDIEPINRLAAAPKDHRLQGYIPKAKSVISIGIRLNHSVVNNLPKSRREYRVIFDLVDNKLDEVAYEISRFLEENRELDWFLLPSPPP